MRAVVTGGAGFIGSNLVDALIASGGEVTVVDDLSTGSRSNLDAALAAGARLVEADISDGERLRAELVGSEPEVVFHLAAQADVRKALADPSFDARVNVVGTINVLEAARSAGGVPLVLASTGGAIYGEGDGRPLPLTETAEIRPETAYGVSKLCGEHYVELYRRLYQQPGVALRLGNVYGPRQDPHGEAGVVAIFCGRLAAEGPLTVFGDGKQTRDFIYVGDVVEALIAAGVALVERDLAFRGPLNVGTGVETSVLDLVDGLGSTGGQPLEVALEPARKGEVQRIAIDPSAAERELGWKARVGLGDGLAATYAAHIADQGVSNSTSSPKIT